MAWHHVDENQLAPVGLDELAANYLVGLIIATFDERCRPNGADQFYRRGFIVDDDEIYSLQRR